MSKSVNYYVIFFIIALIYILAVINIVGIHHADEHYQILEFAHIKLFSIIGDYLPWEYSKRIRSWTQPGLYYLAIQFLRSIKVENPFIWTGFIRFFHALLFVWVMYKMWLSRKEEFTERVGQFVFFYSSFFFWFFPYFSTRNSSETLGIILFLFSYFSFFRVKNSFRNDVLTGLLFGFTFLIRYHLSVMIFFLCLWALIYKKKSILSLFVITLSCFLVMAFGVLVDFWGYGEWQITLWRFYYENIATGYMASVSSAPWWRYFYEVQKELYAPIGIPVVASFLYFWAKYWKHPITWISLSFFVFQSLIAHKELRYIFPLVVFLPYVVSISVRDLIQYKNLKVFEYYLVLLLALNSSLLALSLFKPANYGSDFFKYLYDNKKVLNKVYYTDHVKPHQYINLEMKYFQISDINFIKTDNFENIDGTGSHYRVGRTFKVFVSLKKKSNCEELYPRVSGLSEKIYFGFRREKRENYSLFKCL